MSKALKRFYNEIKEVEQNFFNLRTAFRKDNDDMNIFYFVMIPNDGALSKYPISGRIIKSPGYPRTPPYIQVFNTVGRYNVDVFSSMVNTKTASSVCFDILSHDWNSTYTLSALFGSLMSSIVSITIYQQHGDPIKEFVTMEKLKRVTQEATDTYVKKIKFLPKKPKIPFVVATRIDATQLEFCLPETLQKKSENSYIHGPFILSSTKPLTFKIDLSCLRHTPDVVFSVILTNDPKDLTGKYERTILFRNGVTATAAKKKKGGKIVWFYHGKPFNGKNEILQVTVTCNQFCMTTHNSNTVTVLGDTSISKFKPEEIGNDQFYLIIYLKNKKNIEQNITLPFLDTEGFGYVHDTHVL
jgi:ubiquitin-protein ligase